MRFEDACNDDVKAGVLVMILVEDRYGYGSVWDGRDGDGEWKVTETDTARW
jgi:hypothetical protein